jgi:serine/threonine protein kinase
VTRYELLDRIGVGGMAEIFRGKAVAAGGFEKPVAIKRILPHLSQDRRFVELLIAEAKVLSLLKHRNIVQIFDVGLGDDGQYFLVMEYVDGKDIGAVQRALEQKRRRIPFDIALHIGAEICEALEHAHVSRGPDGKPMSLVHRDVSPSNVLLSRAGEIKLTDFGIAKRAESDATQGGAVRGKFAYISPEQARNEPLDPRSDVFSVGILMWELICNRRLWSGLDDLGALRAVREANAPRPSEIDRKLPPEIDQILMTALARDKTRRFPSCGTLGQKLRSLRYSLDETSGDPATELAKIIESTEEVERSSQKMIAVPASGPNRFDPNAFDGAEATVIRIRTADAFSARDNDKSIVQARQVIDKFEEEETRLASLTGDQMRMLRGGAKRDSVELAAEKPSNRSRRDSEDEMTRAREPLNLDSFHPAPDTPANQHFTPTDNTRPINTRRTPQPQPAVRPAESRSVSKRQGTVPPPMPMPPPPRGPAATPSPLPMPMAPMPQPPGHAYQAPPPNSGYQGWSPPIAPQIPARDATPTAKDSFERPQYPSQSRPQMPQVAGFQKPQKAMIQPWILVVGALIMAALAFAITRAFIT